MSLQVWPLDLYPVSASPEQLVEMQILRLHPRPPVSETIIWIQVILVHTEVSKALEAQYNSQKATQWFTNKVGLCYLGAVGR